MEIVILTEVPLTRRDYERFGIEILSRSFKVSILDCTSWLKPNFNAIRSDFENKFRNYKIIDSYEKFLSDISNVSEGIAIDYLGDSYDTQKVRVELKRKGILRTIVRCGLIPEIRGTLRVEQAFRLGNLFPKIARKLFSIVAPSLRKSDVAPDIAIISGESSLNIKAVKSAKHKVWTHSFDYDVYLKIRDHSAANIEKYAVFLDSDFVFHQEWELSGIKPVVTAERYYPSLNSFFDVFEALSGLKVVIAAHPRSRYDLRPELYAPRVPVMGETVELVRDAALVLTTHSTAISFAVIWKKPIICIYTEEYGNSSYRVYVQANSNLFHAPLINVDDFSADMIDFSRVANECDNHAYTEYIKKYIKKPGTKDVKIWETFSEYVQKNFY